MKKLILLVALSAGLVACKKTEGEGSTSSITGKIIIEDWNANQTTKIGEFPGATEDVYIVYGDEAFGFSDKVEASYDGTFKFNYLQPGKYKVFVYTEKYSSSTGQTINEALIQEVELGKNESIEVPDFKARR
jgi:hypothetical protein